MSEGEAGRQLTRRDLESVIRRAAELEAEGGSSVPELSEQDLVRIAEQVGLSESSVRRALAEHKATGAAGLLADRGFISRLCGPGLLTATRTVSRPADDVRRELEDHFQDNEGLSLIRRTSSSSLWEPDRGVLSSIMRALDAMGRGHHLAKKGQALELRVIPLDEASCQVAVTKDMGSERAEWFWGLGVAAGGSAAALASVFIAGLPGVPDLAALGTPALLALSVGLARTGYRRAVDKMRLILDGLLDRLEHHEPLEPRRPSWRDLLR